MAVPIRVRRGTSGNDWYYFDGVNPMTLLGGGVGGTLADLGVGGIGSITTAEFDTLQQYLINRKTAFDSIAACATCPTEATTLTSEAEQIVAQLTGGDG